MLRFSHNFRRLLIQATHKEHMPSHYDIDRQQKLLAMYRGLLAEYLRQHQQWPRSEVPEFLSIGIAMLRGYILNAKGTLRGWKLEIADHPNDQGPNDDIGGEVAHQRELLSIYRRNLVHSVRQHEQFPVGLAPVTIVHSIEGARAEIGRIKAILRGFGAEIEDLPGEEAEESWAS